MIVCVVSDRFSDLHILYTALCLVSFVYDVLTSYRGSWLGTRSVVSEPCPKSSSLRPSVSSNFRLNMNSLYHGWLPFLRTYPSLGEVDTRDIATDQDRTLQIIVIAPWAINPTRLARSL